MKKPNLLTSTNEILWGEQQNKWALNEFTLRTPFMASIT
jgi:hypothetical protein